MKTSVFLSVILSVLILACKKNKSDGSESPAKTTFDSTSIHITTPLWVIYDVQSSGISVWGLPGIIDNCLKDNTYKFYPDSVLTSFENTNKCSGSADSTQSQWYLFNKNKNMVATILDVTDTAEIIKITSDRMQLLIDYEGNPVNAFFKKK